MNRRDCLALALAACVPVRAATPGRSRLPSTSPRVGALSWYHRDGTWEPQWRRNFIAAMAARGWAEDRVAYAWRYAERDPGNLEPLAKELASLRPDVILAFGSLATRAVTRAAPATDVICGCLDAMAEGYTRSLARPSGRVTGYSEAAAGRAAKILEQLAAIVPGRPFVLLLPAANPVVADYAAFFQRAAREARIDLESRAVASPDEIAGVLHAAKKDGIAAAITLGVARDNESLARAALEARMPLVEGAFGESFVDAGGLFSYRALMDDFRDRLVRQLEKRLGGAPIRDIPFEQPTRFRLEVNQATAARLGLTIPPTLLLAADRVVQ